jgi:hypothetical protein
MMMMMMMMMMQAPTTSRSHPTIKARTNMLSPAQLQLQVTH